MPAPRKLLLAALAVFVAALILAAAATAFRPAAIQTTSYAWGQLPPGIGEVVTVVPSGPQSTGYVWSQPPSWVPIAG